MNKKVVKFILLILLFVSNISFTSVAHEIRENLLKDGDSKSGGVYMRKHFMALHGLPFDESSLKKRLLLIGDSHAQDFLNIIVENGYLSSYQIRTRYIYTRCQISFINDTVRFIAMKDHNFCRRANGLEAASKQIALADVIIFSANWHEWAAKNLTKTMNDLKLRPDQQLIVIGRKNFGKIVIRDYLNLSKQQLLTLRNPVDARQLNINNLMKNSLNRHIFIDQHDLICGIQNNCPIFTNTLRLISFDGSHLTKAGASYLGRILFTHPILKKL